MTELREDPSGPFKTSAPSVLLVLASLSSNACDLGCIVHLRMRVLTASSPTT
ncbi:hypothetical protein [Moritella sp. 28]|uniref:hypothetical protein n=1 Tax=Moritella sp. 28 TaxID=2746232 RepID=UPI001BA6597F|nr:hypothetical protein [Moritella sp. 28]QUM85973.1 hypothetical protein HWV02_16380 [Moritella sp. 28]